VNAPSGVDPKKQNARIASNMAAVASRNLFQAHLLPRIARRRLIPHDYEVIVCRMPMERCPPRELSFNYNSGSIQRENWHRLRTPRSSCGGSGNGAKVYA
jgi:hypothetical protein